MNRDPFVSGLTSGFKWLFFRLPRPFSIALAVSMAGWLFLYDDAYRRLVGPAVRSLLDASPSWVASIMPLILALGILVTLLVGLLLAYNFAALVNWLVSMLPASPLHYRGGFVPVPHGPHPPRPPFAPSTRIGIVLAGGGAKGAYQAGALKAIYEFLERYDALNNVKFISGTSIGSWNAMFWLAGMIRSARGWEQPGCLEWWWKRLSARHLVAPRGFFPSFYNSFFSTQPWQKQFDQIFGSHHVKKFLRETDIRFYLTRSNVRSGELECATNDTSPPADLAGVKYDCLCNSRSLDEFFDRMRMAVFASMDLPPMFPYMKYEHAVYEDGGVIDNLPLRFPAAAGCDLIFVLPLNSDFEQEPNNRSIAARISRVMDVQQGALERHGFKLLNLYNEIAVLRNRIRQLTPHQGTHEKGHDEGEGAAAPRTLKRAMGRKHHQIKIFAVCPDKSFVRTTINTRDLWNTRGAVQAFDIMYSATAELLESFDFTDAEKKPEVFKITKSERSFIDSDIAAVQSHQSHHAPSGRPAHAAHRHRAKATARH